MNAIAWTCPFCGRACTVTQRDRFREKFDVPHIGKHGNLGVTVDLIVCPNPACQEESIAVEARPIVATQFGWITPGDAVPLGFWSLRPQGAFKQFPEFIPAPLREDYQEACAIRDLSPKASATLSRRCMQGMIRGFWGISKNRLVDEIAAIEDKVEPDTWSAIEAVRHLGNIGAHMERDIDVIVEVDPGEAQVLIELIELLFEDWYIAAQHRADRKARVVALAEAKAAEKLGVVKGS